MRFCGLLLLLLLILAVLLFFTTFYVNLSLNGLQSESLGGIFLSLIPPVIIFLLGLTIKQQLFNKNELTEGSSVEELEHPFSVLPEMMEEGVARTTGHQGQPWTENTRLLSEP